MKRLLLVLPLLVASPAPAALIHFSGSTDPADGIGANLIYQPAPGASLQGLFLPTDVALSFDRDSGAVMIDRWTVYDAARAAVLYELGPRDLQLADNGQGEFSGLVGGMTFTLQPVRFEGGFALFVDFASPPLLDVSPPGFPWIHPLPLAVLVVSTPEPSTGVLILVMAALLSAAVFNRRRSR
jgi:hypothetical protein